MTVSALEIGSHMDKWIIGQLNADFAVYCM